MKGMNERKWMKGNELKFNSLINEIVLHSTAACLKTKKQKTSTVINTSTIIIKIIIIIWTVPEDKTTELCCVKVFEITIAWNNFTKIL